MSLRIGLMQGRLLPPKRHPIQEFPAERWQEEFPVAARLGFDAIEFIFNGDEQELLRHPLLEHGCRAIRQLIDATGVAVTSVCGDYFMAHPLHRGSPEQVRSSMALLERLIAQAAELMVTDIILPCVEEASLQSPEEHVRLAERLSALAGACDTSRVRLALELDLPPEAARQLMKRCASPWVRINYDVGNNAALGFDPAQEWSAYGASISSVHIKDRQLGGGTVPLGTGAAQFDRVFAGARAAGYQGLFTIQGARGEDHAATAATYKRFVESLIERHYGLQPSASERSRP